MVFDDATTSFAPVRWLRVDWPAYTDANGATHPAVGDLDGDGRAEIVAGLGAYPNGWLVVWDDLTTNNAALPWIQMNATHTDMSNGMTWPAIGRFRQ
jgi:hypothetical protein